MIGRDNSDQVEIIRRFLLSPQSREGFNRFFALCHSRTIGHLRRLRAAGWQLPLDQVQAEQPLNDIACDILGCFFGTCQGERFHIIFDYFRRHGITDFANADGAELVKHNRILLRGFIQKKVTTLKDDIDPQIANLKRRISEILNGPPHAATIWPGENRKYVYLSANVGHLRENRPCLPREKLRELVLRAFYEAVNRTTWCARLFGLLEQETEYRNAVPLAWLKSEMITVNSEYVTALPYPDGHLSGVPGDYIRRRISAACEAALEWVEKTEAARFVQKGRLSSEDAPAVMKACRLWLEDLALSGEADSIPSYFFEIKPETGQEEYQSRYKYIMDTVTRRVLEELRRRLDDDSTIRSCGGYPTDE